MKLAKIPQIFSLTLSLPFFLPLSTCPGKIHLSHSGRNELYSRWSGKNENLVSTVMRSQADWGLVEQNWRPVTGCFLNGGHFFYFFTSIIPSCREQTVQSLSDPGRPKLLSSAQRLRCFNRHRHQGHSGGGGDGGGGGRGSAQSQTDSVLLRKGTKNLWNFGI